MEDQVLVRTSDDLKALGGILKDHHILIRIIRRPDCHLVYRSIGHDLAALDHILDVSVMLMSLVFGLLPRDGGISADIGIHILAIDLILAWLQCCQIGVL